MKSFIYHGSYYDTVILKPSFKHTNELVTWDETESNKYLYSTTDKWLAITMGLASALSQIGILVDEFSVEDNVIYIAADVKVTQSILRDITHIYLYTLELNNDWVKVNNEHNGVDTEYKTDKTIENIIRKEIIPISDIQKKYVIKNR